jgi:hypothetical protein
MEKVLMVGAIICCAIGAFFVLNVIGGIISFWAKIFREPRNIFAFSISVIYALLTITPIFILIRSKEIQISRLKLLLTAFTEFIVIGLFLAMLFPKL